MAPGPDTDRGYVYPVWEESFKQSAALDNRSLYLKNCKTCETLRRTPENLQPNLHRKNFDI